MVLETPTPACCRSSCHAGPRLAETRHFPDGLLPGDCPVSAIENVVIDDSDAALGIRP